MEKRNDKKQRKEKVQRVKQRVSTENTTKRRRRRSGEGEKKKKILGIKNKS